MDHRQREDRAKKYKLSSGVETEGKKLECSTRVTDRRHEKQLPVGEGGNVTKNGTGCPWVK